MAKQKHRSSLIDTDSGYFLKLVLYLVLGSQWVFLVDEPLTKQIPLPIGLIFGLIFASHEHFKIDRKIEYAVLLVAMFVGYWSQVGIYIQVLS